MLYYASTLLHLCAFAFYASQHSTKDSKRARDSVKEFYYRIQRSLVYFAQLVAQAAQLVSLRVTKLRIDQLVATPQDVVLVSHHPPVDVNRPLFLLRKGKRFCSTFMCRHDPPILGAE